MENQILGKFAGSFTVLKQEVISFFQTKLKPYVTTIEKDEFSIRFIFENKTSICLAWHGFIFETEIGVDIGIEPVGMKGIDTRFPFAKMDDMFFGHIKELVSISERFALVLAQDGANKLEIRKEYSKLFDPAMEKFRSFMKSAK